MQQALRTLATLVTGAMLAAGGYVAALIGPQIADLSARDLPETASFFESAPASTEADAWFQSFDEPPPTGDHIVSTADVPRIRLGESSAPAVAGEPPSHPFGSTDGDSLGRAQPFAAPRQGASAGTESPTFPVPSRPTAAATEVPFGVAEVMPPPAAVPQTKTATLADFAPTATPVSATVQPTTASVETSPNDWERVVARLGERGATNYRLAPVDGGRLRCDVWVSEPAGPDAAPVHRQYSAEGDSPAAAAAAVLERIR